jgi:hypothetical protein
MPKTRDAENMWHVGTYERVQNFNHTEKIGETAQRKEPWCRVRLCPEEAVAWACRKAECQMSFRWGVAGLRWAMGLGSHTSEAPRPETPCHLELGTVVSRDATRQWGWALRYGGDFFESRAHCYEACFMLSIPRRMKTRMRT